MFAYIAVENLPSRRLFAACGYKESAVLKEWAHTFGGGYTDVLVVPEAESQLREGIGIAGPNGVFPSHFVQLYAISRGSAG